ncbi:MAG: 50S ribosomal protein L11 methyltransferase [Anaerolineales bacterium]
MEVSLSVEAEVAESTADVLARHAPGGVVLQIEHNAGEHSPTESGREPPIRVLAYYRLDDSWAGTRVEIERGLWHLGQIRPLPEPVLREVEEEDWAETWKRNYRPLPIGRSLLILPSWIPAGETTRHILKIDPGQAFGTGTHPSTQLCLHLLEDQIQPGDRVVDLGCGSGILSVAAARLGATSVLALDLDDQAVLAAEENARRNGLAGCITVTKGSLAEMASNAWWRAGPARILVANILFGVIVDLLRAGLARAVTPGGSTILSGILREQAQAFEREILSSGLICVERRDLEDWSAWVVRTTAPEGAV